MINPNPIPLPHSPTTSPHHFLCSSLQPIDLPPFTPTTTKPNQSIRDPPVSPDLMKWNSSPSTSWICCFTDLQRISKKSDMAGNTKTIEIGIGAGVDVVGDEVARARVPPPEHLLVMVNGLMGSSADWKFAAQQFVKRIPDKVVAHCSACNSAKLTLDGVDMMGERLAEEVFSVVQRMPGLRKISFVAHSLGGLVARYAIGKLYEPPEQSKSMASESNCSTQSDNGETGMARIAGLEPMNFITVATPHLGSGGHRQLPAFCGFLFLERQAPQTAHLIAGKSGKHLYLTDNDDGKPPLLLRMVTDSYDYKFISALRSFKRRVAYANTSYDYVVGWRTSSIRRPHELPEVNLFVKNNEYPHIVYVEPESSDDNHHQLSLYTQDQKVDFEEEMIRGLRQLPWVRVDVSFHNSIQRFVAHNTIQVNRYWLNSDGVGVISHMIDNFIL